MRPDNPALQLATAQSGRKEAAERVKGVFRGHPEPWQRASPSALPLLTVIIPAEPALWVFLTGTPIPDRVIQTAMMVECTSMSAYRLMDQNMDK
jgi:hypothetical protein